MTPTYERIKSGFYLREKNGFVQKPPYISPLPYRVWGGTDVIKDNEYPPDPSVWQQPYATPWIGNPSADSLAAEAYAKAYDDLLSKIKGESSAMLVVNILERAQSFDMIAKRARDLFLAYDAMRSLDLKGFLKVVGFGRRNVGRKNQWVRSGRDGSNYTILATKVESDSYALRAKLRSAGSMWLEYWFGWKPLIGDIQASLDILTGIAPTQLRRSFSGRGSTTDLSTERWSYPWGYGHTTVGRKFSVIVSCTVRVTDPDALNANKLGLINAATVAWEVVPWSFLVDWFFPVSKYLESLTALIGLDVSNVQVARKKYAHIDQASNGGGRFTSHVSTVNFFEREILSALPTPGLFDRKGTAVTSLSRAATAVSLLLGFLKRSPLH